MVEVVEAEWMRSERKRMRRARKQTPKESVNEETGIRRSRLLASVASSRLIPTVSWALPALYKAISDVIPACSDAATLRSPRGPLGGCLSACINGRPSQYDGEIGWTRGLPCPLRRVLGRFVASFAPVKNRCGHRAHNDFTAVLATAFLRFLRPHKKAGRVVAAVTQH